MDRTKRGARGPVCGLNTEGNFESQAKPKRDSTFQCFVRKPLRRDSFAGTCYADLFRPPNISPKTLTGFLESSTSRMLRFSSGMMPRGSLSCGGAREEALVAGLRTADAGTVPCPLPPPPDSAGTHAGRSQTGSGNVWVLPRPHAWTPITKGLCRAPDSAPRAGAVGARGPLTERPLHLPARLLPPSLQPAFWGGHHPQALVTPSSAVEVWDARAPPAGEPAATPPCQREPCVVRGADSHLAGSRYETHSRHVSAAVQAFPADENQRRFQSLRKLRFLRTSDNLKPFLLISLPL